MEFNYQCMSCLMGQINSLADLCELPERKWLFIEFFDYLKKVDFKPTNPEIMGEMVEKLRDLKYYDDPYLDLRKFYNDLLLGLLDKFTLNIEVSEDPFSLALRYAITGNIIDFGPAHDVDTPQILEYFDEVNNLNLAIDDSQQLKSDLLKAKTLLYIGDNCGEICLDKLLIIQIKELNPKIEIFYGVRQKPVINDSIEEDAYYVGINEYAKVIDNGDYSIGTVINRTSDEFRGIFSTADVIIAKGQGNYEGLSDIHGFNMYLLLMAKCKIVADNLGVLHRDLVCKNVK